ncbi:MAG: methyltransferase domain-containing protein [Rhizobacter sp.]
MIEHVEDPRNFVASLAERLAPGGTLIISTGTLDAHSWRFAGGLYWYCGYPENISFITQAWARAVGDRLGLEITGVQRFAYGEPDARRLGRTRRRFYRKLIGPKLREQLRAWWPFLAKPEAPQRNHGYPSLFEDHMIVCFKKA